MVARRLSLVLLSLAALASPAQAVPPGQNGRLAYAVQPYPGERLTHPRGLYTVNPDGSDVRLIDRHGYNPAWSPDGTRLAYGRKEGYFACTADLYLADADGGNKRKLDDAMRPLCASGDDSPPAPAPAWSATGAIAFSRIYVEGGFGRSEVALIEPSGSGRRPFFNATVREAGFDFAEALDWAPDGSRLVFSRGDIYVAPADGSMPSRISSPNSGPDTTPSWSPDGAKILFGRQDGSWIVNPDGTGQTFVTRTRARPTWSPDGKQVVSLAVPGRGGPFIAVGSLADEAPSCVIHSTAANGLAWQPVRAAAPAAAPGRYCLPPATERADRLAGGPSADEICGLAGGDRIDGLGGDDTLWGDGCRDDGEPPTDATLTTGASDRLIGGTGDDRLYGAGGKDNLDGGAGDDRLSGGPAKDKLLGGAGNDRLDGGAKKNRYEAGPGDDVIRARNGLRDHAIECGPGRDTAYVDARDRTRGCERVRALRS